MIKDFKKGTHFVITKSPNRWNSTYNDNCPIGNNSKIKYPYIGIIK